MLTQEQLDSIGRCLHAQRMQKQRARAEAEAARMAAAEARAEAKRLQDERRQAEARSTIEFYAPRVHAMREQLADLRNSAEYHAKVNELDRAARERSQAFTLEEKIFKIEQKLERAYFTIGA